MNCKGFLKHSVLGRVLPSKYGITMYYMRKVGKKMRRRECDFCNRKSIFTHIVAEDEQWGYLQECPWCGLFLRSRKFRRLLGFQCKLAASTIYWIATRQYRRLMAEDDLFRK